MWEGKRIKGLPVCRVRSRQADGDRGGGLKHFPGGPLRLLDTSLRVRCPEAIINGFRHASKSGGE